MDYVLVDENNQAVNFIVVEDPTKFDIPSGWKLVIPFHDWLGVGSYYDENDGKFYLKDENGNFYIPAQGE